MDIEEYVVQKEQRLRRSSRRIRDFEVFDFNYIPEKPLMRDEVKPIVDALLRYDKTGIANHLLVVGSRGSGKTLLVKYLMKVLGKRHDLSFEYANCRTHNTSFKILASLLGVRPRGLAFEELWERFCAGRDGRTVLVLDEVDLLSEKDKRKDILYLVSRSEESYMAVLLSNNPKFLGLLDESIRGTLQPELVHFRNYTAPQIERILAERAVLGLRRVRRLSVQFHEEPFSYVHFYSNLSYLQSLGLILLVSTKVGRTYTNRIQLLFSPELLEAVWEARFR